ncbi:hypothetical protein K456DRAFT_1480373 [Colletotrichum gloeosporioides 23]|nr:hypothetical protein K456DRAFT_1480373 [Colletotrichum gloeosporioides 23]
MKPPQTGPCSIFGCPTCCQTLRLGREPRFHLLVTGYDETRPHRSSREERLEGEAIAQLAELGSYMVRAENPARWAAIGRQ